jgi:hypothetical protein
MRNAYKIIVRKPEGKGPLGRPRCRRDGNIKMDLKRIMCEDVDWIRLAQDRVQWWTLVNMVMNVQIL